MATIAAFGVVAVLSFENDLKGRLSQTIGIAVLLGTGGLAYALFLLALLGVKPTRWPFVTVCVLGLAGSVYLYRKRKLSVVQAGIASLDVDRRRHSGAGWLMILLIVLQVIVVVQSLALPVYEWDAFAIWALKAKVVAFQGIVPRPSYFTDRSLSYSHLDYPLMVPFLMAGVYGVLGHVNDQAAKLFLPVLYFGLTCIVFGFAKRRISICMAVALTALVVGAPVMLRWAGSGNADMPLAAFCTAAVICMLEWDENNDWHSSVLCGIFSAFAAFTKNEGLAIGILICLGMFALAIGRGESKRRVKGAFWGAFVFLLLVWPWLVWSSEIPRTHENYLAHFQLAVVAGNAFRVPIILGEFARQIVSLERYGLLWIVVLFFAAIGWRAFRERTTVIVWSFLLVQLSVYALVFLVTPWDVREHLKFALDRLFLHVAPLGGLLIAIHYPSQPQRPPVVCSD